MCGIIAIKDSKNIKEELFSILMDLRHRGEDAWGVSFYKKNKIINYKELEKIEIDSTNSIADNFNLAIGHTRYKTQGGSRLVDTQPAIIDTPFKISMVHNGNVTNRAELEKILDPSKFKGNNDIELILSLFIYELSKNKDDMFLHKNIFNSVKNVQNRVEGAYSVLSIFNNGLLAFKDRYGIRPLVLGKKENSYIFSSETSSLEKNGYEIVKELEPGEIIYIDKNNRLFSNIENRKKSKFCVFEYIYFAKKESFFYNKKVKDERVKMGKIVAEIFKEKGLTADFIVPIPQTAYCAAKGFSEELNIPIKEIFIKKENIGRSFIQDNQKNRIEKIKNKFYFNLDVVKDKKIVLIDDSIVRGNTIRYLLKQLKQAEAKKIYFVSASPMIKSQCFFGIDISTKEELIANNRTINDIKELIEVDELIYLPLEKLNDLYKKLGICTNCFLD